MNRSVVKVEDTDHSCVVEAPATLNWCNPVHTGVIDTESAGAASERINVSAVPFIAERPRDAVGFAAVVVEYLLPPISKIF